MTLPERLRLRLETLGWSGDKATEAMVALGGLLPHDYFHGYVADQPHPRMAATGSEGRCELCGSATDDGLHAGDSIMDELRKDTHPYNIAPLIPNQDFITPTDLSNHEDVMALLDHDFTGLQVAHAGLVGTIQRYSELGDFRQHHWQAILQAVEAAIMELQCDECQTKTSRMGLYPIGRGQYACQMHYDGLKQKGLL